MTNTWLILGLTFSIMFNILIILILTATGWGKKIVVRWWRQKTYRKGGWVNTLYFTNNNVLKEIYTKKKDDGSIEINKDKYAVNPKLHVVYDGIPTQFLTEGITEPISFFEDDHSEKISTAEVKKIITNNQHKTGLDLINKYAPIIAIIILALLLLTLWGAYSNWKVFDVIVQGGTGSIMSR